MAASAKSQGDPERVMAKRWSIQEQIIEDPVSGLTFQFEVMPKGDARLRVYGDLPFGNREFIFDSDGREAGAGTAISGLCRASPLRLVST